MDDLISRQAAINWIINLSADIGKVQHQELWHYEQALDEIRALLEQTAEPEITEDQVKEYCYLRNLVVITKECFEVLKRNHEPRRGRWRAVKSELGDYTHYFVCSLCDGIGDETMRYCPDCGARMEESE